MQGIALLAQHAGRFLYPVAEEEAERMQAALATLPEIVRLQVAGSLRRKRETVKDIDMVVSVADSAGDDARKPSWISSRTSHLFKPLPAKVATKSSVVLN